MEADSNRYNTNTSPKSIIDYFSAVMILVSLRARRGTSGMSSPVGLEKLMESDVDRLMRVEWPNSLTPFTNRSNSRMLAILASGSESQTPAKSNFTCCSTVAAACGADEKSEGETTVCGVASRRNTISKRLS